MGTPNPGVGQAVYEGRLGLPASGSTAPQVVLRAPGDTCSVSVRVEAAAGWGCGVPHLGTCAALGPCTSTLPASSEK